MIVGNSRFDILRWPRSARRLAKTPCQMLRAVHDMAGLAFRTTSLARAAAALRQGSIPFVERDGRLVVAARAINALIEFSSSD